MREWADKVAKIEKWLDWIIIILAATVVAYFLNDF